MPATNRTNTPRLRDGVMKRGTTWSYVIRVKDPATGISKPRWVGGFATENDAKAARDDARVNARKGQYIDRNSITVAAYLDQWLEAHAVEVKPKTLQDYRHLIGRHVRPHIGDLRLQAITPARLTKLYRELATSGGRDGTGLSPRTVEYVHAVLRKAFRDAVVVDQILPSNPVERAKRPRKARSEPGRVWTPEQLRAFLDTASQHRLFAFYRLGAYTGARRGELLNLRWYDIDLDHGEVRITGSAAVIAGQRIEGTTKSGRSRTVSIDPGTVQVLRDHRKRQAEERLKVGPEWCGTDDYVFSTA
jgi:integrase